MLETLIVLLVLCWLLGVGTAHVAGGLLHLVLVVVLILVLVRVITGRQAW